MEKKNSKHEVWRTWLATASLTIQILIAVSYYCQINAVWKAIHNLNSALYEISESQVKYQSELWLTLSERHQILKEQNCIQEKNNQKLDEICQEIQDYCR